MNCKEAEERDILEGYLLDRLSEGEREEFELHYFGCESCFSQVQTGLMVQAELQRQPMAGSQKSDPVPRWTWPRTPVFVTVALLFAVGIWWYSARKPYSQPVSSLPTTASPDTTSQRQSPSFTAPSQEELARVEPPAYSAMVLRGGEDETQQTFRKAMQYYAKGDYTHAISGLRAAVQASPRNARFNFYLGACYLLTDQTDLAIQSFRSTISRGDPAYSEPAHFYLAKAYLRKKEITSAEDELQKAVLLHGSMEAEASEILRQLRK